MSSTDGIKKARLAADREEAGDFDVSGKATAPVLPSAVRTRSAKPRDGAVLEGLDQACRRAGTCHTAYISREGMDPPEQRARTLHDGGIQHWPEGVRTFVSIMPDRLHFAREVLHDMVAELQRSAGERMEWHAAQHNHQGRAHWHVAINGQRSEKDIARALHRALEMRAERAREWAREQRARERAPRSLEQALAREMERGRDDVGMER